MKILITLFLLLSFNWLGSFANEPTFQSKCGDGKLGDDSCKNYCQENFTKDTACRKATFCKRWSHTTHCQATSLATTNCSHSVSAYNQIPALCVRGENAGECLREEVCG